MVICHHPPVAKWNEKLS